MDQRLKFSTLLRGLLFHLLILRLRVGSNVCVPATFNESALQAHKSSCTPSYIYIVHRSPLISNTLFRESAIDLSSPCETLYFLCQYSLSKKIVGTYFLGIQLYQKNLSRCLFRTPSSLYMDTQAKLEITVISAVNLENVRRFGRRLRAYAVVGADTSPTCKSTRIDTEGGSYPIWNHNLQLELGTSERTLFYTKASANVTIHVYCKTSFGKKLVGWTKVPFSDIVEGYRDPHSVRFLSYRLKTSKGKPQSGIINLCVRLLPKQYNYYSQQPGFNAGPVHYSEQPGFNSAPVHCSQQPGFNSGPVHCSEQGNIQSINYNNSHQPQPQPQPHPHPHPHPHPQQMTAFSGTYHPSELREAGGSHVGNKNSAYCFPHAAPLVYPPPLPYSSYSSSIK